MASAARLYTPEVLALATGLAALPFDAAMPFHGEARSPSCGSTLAVSLDCDSEGRIRAVGLRAHACAIGQASAAIFAGGAIGRTRDDIVAAAARITDWLGGAALPSDEWPNIAAIEAASAFPGRHGAILLPWKAALAALPSARIGG